MAHGRTLEDIIRRLAETKRLAQAAGRAREQKTLFAPDALQHCAQE